MTMILAWSEQEAARYLETFKAFESKDASTIQKKKEVTFSEQVVDALGCIRSVNKTDAATLTSQFGNLRKVMNASIDDIRLCPGIGEKKARRLHEAFNKPFSSAMAKKRKVERLTTETVIKDFGEHEEGEDMKITSDEIE
jgi:DNA excision repair protein ERCC-1